MSGNSNKFLSTHELRYIWQNTYNATDPKNFEDWKITCHSSAGFISVDEFIFGQDSFLASKNCSTGWIYNERTFM